MPSRRTVLRSFLSVALTLIASHALGLSVIPVAPPEDAEGDVAVPGKVLLGTRARSEAEALAAGLGLPVVGWIGPLGIAELAVPEGMEGAYAALLSLRPEARFAEVARTRCAQRVPRDTFYSSKQSYLAVDQAPAAWSISTGSPDVIIAVVDSGVDTNHPDLKAKLLPGLDLISLDAPMSDSLGHGTFVAGVAAAESDNQVGIAGVSWGSRVLPTRILGPDGVGDTFAEAGAIAWSVDQGAKVVNLSLGNPQPSDAEREAVGYAQAHDVLVVAAAGNSYQYGNPTYYPAAYPGVLAVGAVTVSDVHAPYSNAGPYVSVCAPGGGTDSTGFHSIFGTAPLSLSGGYQGMTGTSAAAPQVTGLAALIRSVKPSLTAPQVKALIERTAVDLGSPGRDDLFGYGRVDFLAALKAAAGPDTTPPVAAITAPSEGAVVDGVVSLVGTAADDHFLSFVLEARAGDAGAWAPITAVSTTPASGASLGEWYTSALPEGPYQLRLRVRDAYDLSSEAVLHLTVDHTAPKVTLKAAADASETTLQVTATVLEPNLKDVALEYGAGLSPGGWTELPTTPAAGGTFTATLDLGGRAAGPYTLRATARDLAGHTATQALSFTWTPPIAGDVNGDHLFNIGDVLVALRLAVTRQTPTASQLRAADVAPAPSGDGAITLADVVLLLRRMLGIGGA
ncbi:MAG TPA: S8 family serine peptidase [Armatimonadota bacterium]|jgi:subtilisin family serine protease